MTTILNRPDDLLKQVESHAARAGSELNDTVADLLRIGLATTATATPAPDESMLERRRALTGNSLPGSGELNWPVTRRRARPIAARRRSGRTPGAI